jgi:hypothetical protein
MNAASNSPAAIEAAVEAKVTAYADALRRRGRCDADMARELQLYRSCVTTVYEQAVNELDEWICNGRWMQ